MPPHWSIEEALPIIRTLAPIVHKCGLDVALRGSVLLKGESDSDLDLIFIVEEPDILDVEGCLNDIRMLPEVRAIGPLHPVGAGERNATIWLRGGRHIEARFFPR